jgi:hypothetical protein
MKRLAIGVALVGSGCLTVTARVRGGPTIDTTGTPGWEVGVAAGIGYTSTRSTSIRTTPTASAGDRGIMLGTTIEVGSSAKRFGWYGGIAAELGTGEDEFRRRAYGAALRPLSFERNEVAPEKGFDLHQRKALSIGLEASVGVGASDTGSARGLFALHPVVDYTLTSAD